jgi:phage terminase large subunit-like protein
LRTTSAGAPSGQARISSATAKLGEKPCFVSGEGEWAGRPFRLNGGQRELLRTIFGWKKPDGTRLFRIVYLEVPRKNGKAEFDAGLAILLLLGDAEKGGQG